MATNMTDSKKSRLATLCALYFSQGVPWAFITVAYVTYLVGKDSITDAEVATLTLMGMVPWIIGKLVLGPMIDRYQFKPMGRRRPWILISQLGMIITIAAFLLIDSPDSNLGQVGLFFFVHNIFAALQDVSSDALAVDVLPDEEVAMANGLMFICKGFGFMFAALVLGSVLLNSGFQAALMVQVPVLLVIMLIPLFVLEREGERRFPWSEGNDMSSKSESGDVMKLGDIISGIKGAFSNSTARWALLLSTIMWFGGGMGGGLGIIDVQFPFIFVEDLNWSEEEYLALKGMIIFLATMLGFLVGGFLGGKYGIHKVMTYAVGTGIALTVLWSLARSNWENESFMRLAWIIWTFVWGIVGANLIALLMTVTTKDIGGTQFSIYMTAINIGALGGTAVSPMILNALGDNYPNLFLVGALCQAIMLMVLLKVDLNGLENNQTDSTQQTISESE